MAFSAANCDGERLIAVTCFDVGKIIFWHNKNNLPDGLMVSKASDCALIDRHAVNLLILFAQ